VNVGGSVFVSWNDGEELLGVFVQVSDCGELVCVSQLPQWSRKEHHLFPAEFRVAVWHLVRGHYSPASVLSMVPMDVLELVIAHHARDLYSLSARPARDQACVSPSPSLSDASDDDDDDDPDIFHRDSATDSHSVDVGAADAAECSSESAEDPFPVSASKRRAVASEAESD
jgi:hypothetical protein